MHRHWLIPYNTNYSSPNACSYTNFTRIPTCLFPLNFSTCNVTKMTQKNFPFFACNQISTYSFIHSFVSLVLRRVHRRSRKRFLHTLGSSAPSFNFYYPAVTVRSSSSYFRLLPRLPVASILPSIFPSLTCFRRQLLSKM